MKLARLLPVAALFTLAGCGKPSQELCEEFADHVTELTVKEVSKRMGDSTEDLTRAQMASRRDDDVKKCMETASTRKVKCVLELDDVANLDDCK
ncbi:MAG: hypothetical protein AAFU79_14265 [Myxococcota bacterium]